MTRSTVRVVAKQKNSDANSIGTGFAYQVMDQNGMSTAFVITNKHVVKNMDYVELTFSSAPDVNKVAANAQPDKRVESTHHIDLFENHKLECSSIVNHPNPDVDLCAINTTLIMKGIIEKSQLRLKILDRSWLCDENEKANLKDIQKICMVGYPQGIFDEHNNTPISRVAYTATHPLASYKGKTDFLIDTFVIGGSSGSPVFAYETGVIDIDGQSVVGTRVSILGVVHSTIFVTEKKQVKVKDIPTNGHIESAQFLNLGVAMHAERILELDRHILGMM
mmetsp:Transcript_32777/g.104432  ORF Transcript_32777/g.104432 Transcript_32777/m.104432 type:complete len:278 (+) Transcript_32777:2389-3222(+)